LIEAVEIFSRLETAIQLKAPTCCFYRGLQTLGHTAKRGYIFTSRGV
jgi:hypothetical protein